MAFASAMVAWIESGMNSLFFTIWNEKRETIAYFGIVLHLKCEDWKEFHLVAEGWFDGMTIPNNTP